MGSRRSEEEGRRTVGRPSPAHRPRSGNLRRGQIWGDLCWIRQSAGRPSTGRDRELWLRLQCLQRRRRRRPLSRNRSRRRPAAGPAAAAAETPPQSPPLGMFCSRPELVDSCSDLEILCVDSDQPTKIKVVYHVSTFARSLDSYFSWSILGDKPL
jgi:hypothetical protein